MRRTLSRLALLGPPSTPVQTRFAPVVEVRQPTLWDEPKSEQDIRPGRHVISVCQRHKISFPFQVYRLEGIRLWPNPFKLNAAASQNHSFASRSMRYFDTVEHPFAKTLLDIYIEKKKEPLWIHCYAHGGTSFPIKKASKKLAHAIRDALAAAGYDRFGRRVLGEGESSPVTDLYGTLRVSAGDPQAICNRKFADLLEDAKKIVACAEIQLQRGPDGRHIRVDRSSPAKRHGGKAYKPARKQNSQQEGRAHQASQPRRKDAASWEL
ncbi:hypothetical protein F4802DRAFT_562371 [Xylaria palmicola]|nr:hypothetical protein F4802DRAFT_562371 [Xylaria palmicola]